MVFFKRLSRLLAEKNIHFLGTTRKKSVEVLIAGEIRQIEESLSKHKEDFATGRWCARKLLKKIGVRSSSILKGGEGEPIWPEGVVGSISHTRGAWCASLASREHYLSLGIDIEPLARDVSRSAVRYFTTIEEREWLKKKKERALYEKLVFCAKESIFKLLYPLLRSRFYFQSVTVFPPSRGTHFTALLNRDLNKIFRKGRRINGFYFHDKKWILVLTCLKG
ncbi:MAG: 4'-phosphopantetheinyl transferase superfamily protein [bacterium]|nr:4'-phosphopantetheinyl transferase superfamily protein [bacterium]